MKLLGHIHQHKPQHVVERHPRKQRSHRDASPVPSSYSEPVSLRPRKGVTGELPWLHGYGTGEDEDETQSLKSLQCSRRVKRPRALANASDLKLPPLAVNSNKVRCSLMVRGSSYPRVSAFPPICKPRTARTQGLERPPSRAGKRGMERVGEVEDSSRGADPSHRTTENLHIHPPASTCVPAQDHGGMAGRTQAMAEVLVELGFSIPRGHGGGRDLLPLKPRGWKELWHEMMPHTEGMRLPSKLQQHGEFGQASAPQLCGRREPQAGGLPPNSGHGPYVWRPACRCSSPALPHFLQLPGSSIPFTPACCLATRTVELASSKGGLLPKITMTCPTPRILP